MKSKSVLLFIVFFLIFVLSLSLNIAFVQNKKIVETTKFTVDSIYFDLSLIEDKTKATEIENFINSKNTGLFLRVINQNNNPASQFYAFCALMKNDQQKAKNNLEKILLNPTKVSIIIDKDNKKNDSYLGYAVLLLLKQAPNNLINVVDNNFFSSSQKVLQKAFQSKIVQNNNEFKTELSYYLKFDKASGSLSSDVAKLINSKQINQMTNDEKLLVSSNINGIPEGMKENIIKNIINDDNQEIIINLLKSINEDAGKNVAYAIQPLISGNYSYEITKLSLEKYCGILKGDSLQTIRDNIYNITSTDLIVFCLNQIEKYGGADNYEFLKNFLKITYPELVNIAALNAIVKTTYKEKPDDVLNTMSFVLRKIDKENLAYIAIKFHIDNNILKNSASVLYRLNQKESLRIKMLGLDYMDKFNIAEGYSFLRELVGDEDQNISARAKKILDKYGAGYEGNESINNN
jgi:hypothetical protein